jgi:hypothetical protein
MAYFPFYAFEEIPSVFGDTPNEVLSLTTPMKQLTRYISDGEVDAEIRLASGSFEAEKVRREVLKWYLQTGGDRKLDPVALAQAVFNQYDPANQQLMMRILLRLVHVSPTSLSAKTVPLEDVGNSAQKMIEALGKNGIVNIGGDTVKIITLCDPILAEKWNTLIEWCRRDQAFLLWRQKLDNLAQAWNPSEADDDTLFLRGRSLDEARSWMSDRVEDLNDKERDFIDASVEQALKQQRQDEEQRFKQEATRQELLKIGAASSSVTASTSPYKILIIILVAVGMLTSVLYFTEKRKQQDELRFQEERSQLVAERDSQRKMQAQLTETISNLQQQLTALSKTNEPPQKPRQQTTPRTTPATRQLRRDDVLNTALQLFARRDIRYVYGGKSPKEGFDSSGFVTYCLRSAGYAIDTRSCNSACLADRFPQVATPEIGDIAFISNDIVMFVTATGALLGIDGSTGVVQKSPQVYGDALRYYLRPPFTDKTNAQAK